MPGLFDTLRGLGRRRSPFDAALAAHTRVYFQSGRLLSDLPQAQKDRIVAELQARIAHVRAAADPRARLRALLVDAVVDFSELAALSLTEAEKPAVAWGRHPYVSGALHPHIAEAAAHSEELTNAWRQQGLTRADELIAWCNRRGAVRLYLMNGLSLMRSETGDAPPARDWFKPLAEAVMVVREYGYREQLGLPQLVPTPADAAAYHGFMEEVRAGAPDPLPAWSARHPNLPLDT